MKKLICAVTVAGRLDGDLAEPSLALDAPVAKQDKQLSKAHSAVPVNIFPAGRRGTPSS